MGVYGNTAVDTVKEIVSRKSNSPNIIWDSVVTNHTKSITGQKKLCPQKAFLGLCEEGYIKGIKKGDYSASGLNKDYAIQAVSLIKSNNSLLKNKTKLWSKITKKNHNQQMDVVISLWENNLINTEEK